MNENRWLVVGAGGQLGTHFVNKLSEQGLEHLALKRSNLDVTDFAAVTIQCASYRPTHIVNCSAWVDVEAAESHKAETFALNATALGNFVEYAKAADALIINFSTDYVFNGEKITPYLPTDSVDPLNVYGRSKVAGEELLHAALPDNAVTFRTSWLMGRSAANFVYRMGERALLNEPVQVVNDQVGVPTSCGELSTVLISTLQDRRIIGIRHLTNSGQASRYEWAKEIYSLLGSDPLLVSGVSSDLAPTKAKRPHFSVLSNGENESLGLSTMSPWQDALAVSSAIADLRSRR